MALISRLLSTVTAPESASQCPLIVHSHTNRRKWRLMNRSNSQDLIQRRCVYFNGIYNLIYIGTLLEGMYLNPNQELVHLFKICDNCLYFRCLVKPITRMSRSDRFKLHYTRSELRRNLIGWLWLRRPPHHFGRSAAALPGPRTECQVA